LRRLDRLVQRLVSLAAGLGAVSIAALLAFPAADRWLPELLAVAATYGIAACGMLPLALWPVPKNRHRNHVPRYTFTGGSRPGDRVNIVLGAR